MTKEESSAPLPASPKSDDENLRCVILTRFSGQN